jgi:hypothetical protein
MLARRHGSGEGDRYPMGLRSRDQAYEPFSPHRVGPGPDGQCGGGALAPGPGSNLMVTDRSSGSDGQQVLDGGLRVTRGRGPGPSGQPAVPTTPTRQLRALVGFDPHRRQRANRPYPSQTGVSPDAAAASTELAAQEVATAIGRVNSGVQRRQEAGASTLAVANLLRRSWSRHVTPLVSLTPDLRVPPGQPDHRSLNQGWKVRMLAGWGHHRCSNLR